jgi:hypothetical protein
MNKNERRGYVQRYMQDIQQTGFGEVFSCVMEARQELQDKGPTAISPSSGTYAQAQVNAEWTDAQAWVDAAERQSRIAAYEEKMTAIASSVDKNPPPVRTKADYYAVLKRLIWLRDVEGKKKWSELVPTIAKEFGFSVRWFDQDLRQWSTKFDR